MSALDVVTPPALEPLDVATAKVWARIDTPAFDATIPMMITAARQHAEHELGSRLITQTLRAQLEDWPAATQLFRLHPVQSIAVTYWNGAAWVAGPAVVVGRGGLGENYVRLPSGAYFPAWTSTGGAVVRVDFVVGYGDTPESVPQSIRQFIAAHVAYWVRNPEAAVEMQMIPSPFLSSLLDPFRTYL